MAGDVCPLASYIVERVVIVGASLAGVRTASALRREGFTGNITLIGDEPHRPYDRPPLSKQVLQGKWGDDKTLLLTVEQTEELNAEWILGDAAQHLDVASRSVHTASGREVKGTSIVIATGTRARRLPFSADNDVFAMRTLDDARRLVAACDALPAHATVAVIGGGFIGAEVATALHARELRPIVIEAQVRPLQGILGDVVATWLEGLPEAAGIELRVQQQVNDVVRHKNGFLITTPHDALEADLVVVGVGAVPNIEWLHDSGLNLQRGLVVDEFLEAAPGVWGAGDVAVFPYHSAGESDFVRIEHWQIANDHASYVARSIVAGSDQPFRTVPYFWSDQYGKKIQMLGHPRPSDEVELVSGSPHEGKWLAHYRRHGAVTGVVALNNARELMLSRPLLESV